MARVIQRCFEATGQPCFICDFSPPRSGDPSSFTVPDIPADFISVNYHPGRSVRPLSPIMAEYVRRATGRDVVFTVATRDMNKLALQSLLLGAQLLGLENLVVAAGDPLGSRDLGALRPVDDYTPTGLIAAATSMNQGRDFRGGRLRSPANFCIGATIDLGRELEGEARLAHRKLKAGAQFFITQPIFDPSEAFRFLDAYSAVAGEDLTVPVFYGLAILERDGVVFSRVPAPVTTQLEQGRPGVAIAMEQYQQAAQAGLRNVYLVPPIRRGGARDYEVARAFLELVSSFRA